MVCGLETYSSSSEELVPNKLKKMATITQTVTQPRNKFAQDMASSLSIRTLEYNDTERVRFLFVEGMRSLISPIVWSILLHPIFLGLLLAACAGLAASFHLRVMVIFLLVALAAVYAYAYKMFYDYTKDCLNSDDLRDIEKYYLKRPRSNFWTAVLDGQVVGMVALDDKSKDVGELRRMSVDSNVRGRGIAQKLLNNLLDFCRVHGYREVTLGTSSLQDPAIRLYKKNGFQLVNSFPISKTVKIHSFTLKL